MDLQSVHAPGLGPGLAAIGFYTTHVAHWVRLRKAENALWACHLGCLFVGIGWLAPWPLANAIGLLWLLPGIFFWGLFLADGGLFTWSSFLTHVGGNVLGLWGVVVLGFPAGAWWKAGAGYVLLILLCRPISRLSENVNFSLRVWPGWETRFPSYRQFLVLLVMGAFGLFLVLELLLRHFLPRTT
jgi:hypothetical protein